MSRLVGRRSNDPLLRWLVGTAVGLAVLHAGLALLWGTGPALPVLPWHVPTLESFSILSGAAVAFLCLGRSLVLRQPHVLWIGLAFWANAILTIIYVLTWPGLIEGSAILTASVSTFAWVWHEKWTVLAVMLAVAPFLPWLGPSRDARVGAPVIAIGAVSALVGLLTVAYGDALPLLVADGRWTQFNFYWTQAIALVFALGGALSLRRYFRDGDAVLAYVAMVQIASAFAMEDALGDIWGFWWYFHRVLLVAALSAILFGLLSEYVGLYHRERERTRESELLRQEAEGERNRLQSLIDTAPVGIVFYLAPDGCVELLNKAAEAILGKGPTERMSVSEQAAFYHVSRLSGEPFPPQELPVSRSLRGESCIGVELLIRQPSGRELCLLVNSSPIRDAEEHIVGAVATFEDITRVKEQERLRDEFLATASHELKTPVTSIKGYVQLMQHWAPGGHEPREGKAFEVINVQADRIARRMQEMLEVARLRAAPPSLRREHFDLAELASQVVSQMQATTEIHRVVLRREAAAPVEADRERIEDALVGLLDNAIRYSPKGGEIEVRVWTREGEAVVSVRDRGVGIPRERQAHIFEPFYEPVPPGAPGYRSIAPLSLYLSKLTIERHGGRIWFESEEGKGSTFYFALPLAREGGDGNPR